MITKGLVVKGIGIACTVGGCVISVAQGWVADQQMKDAVAKEVSKQLNNQKKN